jgi:hypothetical protein
MSETTFLISRRSPSRVSRAAVNRPASGRTPGRHNRPQRNHVILVAAIYAVPGFVVGALIGAFFGWFFVPACLGAAAGAVAGAWIESRE